MPYQRNERISTDFQSWSSLNKLLKPWKKETNVIACLMPIIQDRSGIVNVTAPKPAMPATAAAANATTKNNMIISYLGIIYCRAALSLTHSLPISTPTVTSRKGFLIFLKIIGKCTSPRGTKIHVDVSSIYFSVSSPLPSQNSTSPPNSSGFSWLVPRKTKISSNSCE